MGRTKKVEEEVESEEEIDEKPVKKPARKAPAKKAAPKKPAPKKKKELKEEEDIEEADEISEEISVDDDDTFPEADPSDKTEITRKVTIKKTDPNSKLKDLTPLEIIQYLIDKGEADLNPSLKRGGITYKNLLLDKRGRHRNAGPRRNNGGGYRNNRGPMNGGGNAYSQDYQGGYQHRQSYGPPGAYDDMAPRGPPSGPHNGSYSRGRQGQGQGPRQPYQVREPPRKGPGSSQAQGGRGKGPSKPSNSRQPFQAAPQEKIDGDLYDADE